MLCPSGRCRVRSTPGGLADSLPGGRWTHCRAEGCLSFQDLFQRQSATPKLLEGRCRSGQVWRFSKHAELLSQAQTRLMGLDCLHTGWFQPFRGNYIHMPVPSIVPGSLLQVFPFKHTMPTTLSRSSTVVILSKEAAVFVIDRLKPTKHGQRVQRVTMDTLGSGCSSTR